ncbi:MAG: Hsp20/alpha crystallin family protein [Zetaproteobacteria bacterium]|nr:MAG: Hsp20/alpha crystallin family protein [Zetaproteobacteria bacterium]
MFGLTRWNEPRGIGRLRQEMDEMFDRFFTQEDWVPGRINRSLRTFHRDLDDLFGGFFGSDWLGTAGSEGERTFWPRPEMSVKDGEQILRLEVPGFKPEEVEVNVVGNGLSIRGEQKTEGDKEQSRRIFSCAYTLPEAVEPDKVKAKLSHGVLEVRMPASPKLVGKKIPIEIGGGEAPEQLKAA